MWEHYRKTFWPIQAMILMVSVIIYFGMDRVLPRAAIFFAIMQVGAVVGAAWAFRLKSLILRNQSRLPLNRR